jgi:hypothetical protein
VGDETAVQEQTTAEQTYHFAGAIIEEGRAIRGDFTVVTTGTDALGEPTSIDQAGAIKLEKDAGDVVVVTPAPVDTGDGLQGGEAEGDSAPSDPNGGGGAAGEATEGPGGAGDSDAGGGGGAGVG